MMPRAVCNVARRVPLSHARALSVALAALVAGVGCNFRHADDCQSSDSRCTGDMLAECVLMEDGNGSYWTWSATSCGAGSCETDDQGAFCALDAAPDPSCSADGKPVCIDTTVTQCRSGYRYSTLDCSSGVSAGPPSPDFLGGPASQFCVTSDASVAFEGLRAPPIPAVQNPVPVSFCATEQQPNSVCRGVYASEPTFTDWSCSGDDRIQCWDGYVVSRTSCNGQGCDAKSGLCVGPG
jgi:hypothetical protein